MQGFKFRAEGLIFDFKVPSLRFSRVPGLRVHGLGCCFGHANMRNAKPTESFLAKVLQG